MWGGMLGAMDAIGGAIWAGGAVLCVGCVQWLLMVWLPWGVCVCVHSAVHSMGLLNEMQ